MSFFFFIEEYSLNIEAIKRIFKNLGGRSGRKNKIKKLRSFYIRKILKSQENSKILGHSKI